MDVNDYLQLLSGHGLVRKYGNFDLCTVNPKKKIECGFRARQ